MAFDSVRKHIESESRISSSLGSSAQQVFRVFYSEPEIRLFTFACGGYPE